MHEIKTKKYKGSFLLKFAVVCLAIFAVISLISQQLQIAQKKQELQAIEEQLNIQQIRNEELKNSLENSGDLQDYAEDKARRDLDYAMPGERIFVDVGGSD